MSSVHFSVLLKYKGQRFSGCIMHNAEYGGSGVEAHVKNGIDACMLN